MAQRNLQPTPVHIDHEDGIGYDRVDVPMCHACRLEMFPTHECEHCGREYLDISDAAECCQHRQGRPMPDGGRAESSVGTLRTEYDPNASRVNLTECPGCGEEIFVFPKGTIAQPREEPIETGVMPGSLLDMAFVPHYCEANDREWVCHHCKTRWDDKTDAEKCCRWEAQRAEASLVCNFDPHGGNDVE